MIVSPQLIRDVTTVCACAAAAAAVLLAAKDHTAARTIRRLAAERDAAHAASQELYDQGWVDGRCGRHPQ